METNAYYLKKIRDILNQRLEIEKSFNGISSNQDAKYLKDIYNVVKDLPEGGGGSLPPVTSEDNGKVLKVLSGQWTKGSDRDTFNDYIFIVGIDSQDGSKAVFDTTSLATAIEEHKTIYLKSGPRLIPYDGTASGIVTFKDRREDFDLNNKVMSISYVYYKVNMVTKDIETETIIYTATVTDIEMSRIV